MWWLEEHRDQCSGYSGPVEPETHQQIRYLAIGRSVEELKTGDYVRGTGSRSDAVYTGFISGKPTIPSATARILVHTKSGEIQHRSKYADIKNVERIEEVSNVNAMVGPKPEPVSEPQFVTPFRSDGRAIVDANKRVVFRIESGDYMLGSAPRQVLVHDAYRLADMVAEAMNEKFGKKEAPSPF